MIELTRCPFGVKQAIRKDTCFGTSPHIGVEAKKERNLLHVVGFTLCFGVCLAVVSWLAFVCTATLLRLPLERSSKVFPPTVIPKMEAHLTFRKMVIQPKGRNYMRHYICTTRDPPSSRPPGPQTRRVEPRPEPPPAQAASWPPRHRCAAPEPRGPHRNLQMECLWGLLV